MQILSLPLFEIMKIKRTLSTVICFTLKERITRGKKKTEGENCKLNSLCNKH